MWQRSVGGIWPCKARVALEALRESVKAIATCHELHSNQVGTWKRRRLEAVPKVFAGGQDRKLIQEYEAKVRELHTEVVGDGFLGLGGHV